MTEKAALHHFLNAQRAGVLAILDGLTDAQLTTALLPSGWTPLGMVEHLGHAERHWFQEVMRGTADPLPTEPDAFEFYRDQCARSDAVIEATDLDATPVGRHDSPVAADTTDLRRVILHMIEETARHAGHLDVVRELFDGATGLGPR